MSLSSSSTSQAKKPSSQSNRGSWMFADPYAYQYSTLDDAPIPSSQLPTVKENFSQQEVTASANYCSGLEVVVPTESHSELEVAVSTVGAAELEGSAPRPLPSITEEPYEIAAIIRVGAAVTSSPPLSSPSSPYGIGRSRLSIGRGNQKIFHHRDHKRLSSVQSQPLTPKATAPPQQADWSGLIPAMEHLSMNNRSTAGKPRSCAIPPGYVDGLIPTAEMSASPKDFDTILRSMKPISKAEMRRGRSRGDRYYQKFEEGFSG
ncbi:hypothetical protein F5Y16DRAFT_302049 [Xylariaceae sp. FL0255]|nr:hypothetical protein F5Y16DRAFT_302049 [Xylariaceae sp. FL0255]